MVLIAHNRTRLHRKEKLFRSHLAAHPYNQRNASDFFAMGPASVRRDDHRAGIAPHRIIILASAPYGGRSHWQEAANGGKRIFRS